MNTKDMSFIELHQLIGRKTAGISIDAMVLVVRCKEDPCGHILIRGKAMAGRAKHLFQLVNCALQEVQFTDQQRFKQLVFEFKARMQNLLGGSGHKITASRMEAKLNVSG